MSFDSLQSVATEYRVDLAALLEKISKACLLKLQPNFTQMELEVLKVSLEFHL